MSRAELTNENNKRPYDDVDDDAAEANVGRDDRDSRGKHPKPKGQNKSRRFGSSREEVSLCQTRVREPEFSPESCKFGQDCRFEHDLRKYLKEHKRQDLTTFGGVCPIWSRKGYCEGGWKCRFVSSHMEERTTDDGREELVLREKSDGQGDGTYNNVSTQDKADLLKRRFKTPKADEYMTWFEKNEQSRPRRYPNGYNGQLRDDRTTENAENNGEDRQDNRAQYIEPPFLPSEKRRIYYGPDTPILAPLTTQGNMPFRRLCVDYGAQVTWSEMAVGLPLIQGQKSEWALMRAHESEISPPTITNPDTPFGYDNSRDLKFGAQIAANKPWLAAKATDALTTLCPKLRAIDLNCGCPIDLIFKQGAGSGLLDQPGKMEKILRSMNAVSGEVPITVKIRMGNKDNKPTAEKLVDRLIYGGQEAQESGEGPCGIAAITLHGRSRQQRYTKRADWEYISECAAMVKRYNEQEASLTDTIRHPDSRYSAAPDPKDKIYFIGNGDCYSHEAYSHHLSTANVDAVMVARGALIKPWIFEEISTGTYIDKSATERLAMVEQYVKYGLETWGSDEMGVGTTRRFLLEWLSFAYRYVPVGILEHLPPSLQDRPPAFRGRNDLETLLASGDFRDWIKIRFVFYLSFHFTVTTCSRYFPPFVPSGRKNRLMIR